MTDAHRLVAAVLAELPVRADGMLDIGTVAGWKSTSVTPGFGWHTVIKAEPFARAITVAVLRELAEEFAEEHEGDIADKIGWKVDDIEAAARG